MDKNKVDRIVTEMLQPFEEIEYSSDDYFQIMWAIQVEVARRMKVAAMYRKPQPRRSSRLAKEYD